MENETELEFLQGLRRLLIAPGCSKGPGRGVLKKELRPPYDCFDNSHDEQLPENLSPFNFYNYGHGKH